MTVEEVKKSLPFKRSRFHIRFLTKIGSRKVWVDTTRDNVAVPTYNDQIMIKALKLPEGVKPKIVKVQKPVKKAVKTKEPEPTHNEKKAEQPPPEKPELKQTVSDPYANLDIGGIDELLGSEAPARPS